MKKLSLVAALLALAGSACGSDGKSDKKSDAGNANGGDNNGNNVSIPDGGGGEEVPFPKCERDQVESYPDFDGPPVWTSQDQMNCATACGMAAEADSEACIMANCPGYEMFNDCVNGVLLSCLTGEGKDADCRSDWETYICCADDKCGMVAEAEQEACLDKNCMSYIDKVGECIDENGDPSAQIQPPCLRQVIQRCIKPTPTTTSLPSQASLNSFFLRNVTKQMTQLRSAR